MKRQLKNKTVWVMTDETIKAGFTREQCETRLKAIFERGEKVGMLENHCNPVAINVSDSAVAEEMKYLVPRIGKDRIIVVTDTK